MNIKIKRFLIGMSFIVALFIFLLFWLDKEIIYLIPSTRNYIQFFQNIFIFSGVIGALCLFAPVLNWFKSEKKKNSVFKKYEDSVYVAKIHTGKKIYLTPKERTQHIHVIGTTGVGKTEFALNMMFQDIEQKRGFLLIEHKSDHKLLDQIYAKVKKEGREKDFHLFSLIHPNKTSTYNPLIGDDPEQIAERVFRSFDISHEFYKNVQFQWLSQVIRLLTELNEPITFEKLFECICHKNKLESYLQKYEYKNTTLYRSIHKFLQQAQSSQDENLKGLEVYLLRFATGKLRPLLNVINPDISLDEALSQNKIIYFQLPTMKYFETASSIGKMVLQDFQSAVSTRQTMHANNNFYACYLDEFSSIAYPAFAELISKARSANVGLVLSHQAIGDLTKVSEAFSDAILTNTNIKAVFRCPDPKTAEYFGDSFGTETTTYNTEQIEAQLVGDPRTGLGSKRETEKYVVHPNVIKKFNVGCGVISIATSSGVKIHKCFFPKTTPLKTETLPDKKRLTLIKNTEVKNNEKPSLDTDPDKVLY